MDTKKATILKQQALKYEALFRLSQSPEYQKYLKPILEEAFQNLWPDPSKAASIQEFHKQYTEQWGRAMAYKELYNLLASSGTVAQNLAAQVKSPEKNYAIT